MRKAKRASARLDHLLEEEAKAAALATNPQLKRRYEDMAIGAFVASILMFVFYGLIIIAFAPGVSVTVSSLAILFFALAATLLGAIAMRKLPSIRKSKRVWAKLGFTIGFSVVLSFALFVATRMVMML